FFEAAFMCVPALVVERAAIDNFDKADAGFDEAAREEAALAEGVTAIGIAELIGLAVEIEGAQERAEDEAAGAIVDFALLGGSTAGATGGELLVELRGKREAALQDFGRNGGMHVFGQFARLVDFERFIARAENAAVYVTGFDARFADAD